MAFSSWQLLLGPLLVILLSALPGVSAEQARVLPILEAPKWQQDSQMHLELRAPETEALPLTYTLYPLTHTAGLNQTEPSKHVGHPVIAPLSLGNLCANSPVGHQDSWQFGC